MIEQSALVGGVREELFVADSAVAGRIKLVKETVFDQLESRLVLVLNPLANDLLQIVFCDEAVVVVVEILKESSQLCQLVLLTHVAHDEGDDAYWRNTLQSSLCH